MTKDIDDRGTMEFPQFYDKRLVNAVSNLEKIFTVEGTKATKEVEDIVLINTNMSNTHDIDTNQKILELVKEIHAILTKQFPNTTAASMFDHLYT